MKDDPAWILWNFTRDSGFYMLLVFLNFLSITLLVASARAVKLDEARTDTIRFLKQWTSPFDNGAIKTLAVIGVTTGAALFLVFQAFYLNRLGDATLPIVSGMFNYFGDTRVQWENEERYEWTTTVQAFRRLGSADLDRDAWEKLKANLGKYDVRFFRVMVYLFLIVLIAGLLDLFGRGEFRRRGALLATIGTFGVFTSLFLWTERQGNYVENLVAAYQSTQFKQNKTLPVLSSRCEQMVFGKKTVQFPVRPPAL
jgi:hypothetical protein